jgi:hypothetical protein
VTAGSGTYGERMRLADPLPPDVRLLHIGLAKTGTTALQSTARERRAALLEQCVRYPGGGLNHREAVSALMGRRWGWSGPGGAVPSLRHWDRLMSEVEAETERRVWISHEFAAESDDETARRFADALGERVHVVVTLRPYAAMLVSSWQQYLKTGVTRTFDRWLEAVLADPPAETVTPTYHRRSNQGGVVRRWAAAVGADHLTAVVVDKAAPTRLTDAFEALLDLPPGFLVEESLGGLEANRSLSAQESEVLRRLNVALQDQGVEWREYDLLLRKGGLGRLMQARNPGPDEEALVLPAWAAERASDLGRRYAEEIAATGVGVIGDLAVLAEPVEGVSDLPPAPATVDLDVAVELAAGLLSAGTGRGPFFAEGPRESAVRGLHDYGMNELAGSVAHRVRRRIGARRSRGARPGS